VTQKQLLIVFLSSLGLVVLPRVVDACDCVRDPRPARSSSDVIFVGRVVQSQPLAFVELEVRETFKGKLEGRVRIATGQNDCDYFLPPVVTPRGSEFLVYGTVRDGKVLVNRCADPGPVGGRIRELRELRQRVKK
jgi:hypothetical protein